MKYSKTLSVILLITVFTCSHSISIAQSNRGVVLDENSNKPIAGVNISLKSTWVGTVTNEKGEFNIKVFSHANENDTLYFSHVGYTTRMVTISELKLNENSVKLSEGMQNLKEVTIVANQQLITQIRYKKLAPLKDGLFSFGSLLVGDKIYVVGGDNSFDTGTKELREVTITQGNIIMRPAYSWQSYSGNLYIYDIPSDTWEKSNLKFSKRAYHSINYYNDKIYVLGGKNLSANRKFEYLDDEVEVYDLKQNTILVDHTNPHQAVNFASFTYDDNLIVMGGSIRLKDNQEKEFTGKVHLLNLKTGYWYELQDMPNAKETKGVLIKNTIYLVGGRNLRPLKEIESYNVKTAEWKTEGQLFYDVTRPAVAYNDNIIYIFEDGIIQTYNIDTKELNMYLIDLPLKSCELFYANGKLYILGGIQGSEFTFNPSSDLYSVDLSEFTKTQVNRSATLN